MHSVCAQLRMGAQAPSRALTLHLPAPVAAPPPAPGCRQPPPYQGSCLAAPWGAPLVWSRPKEERRLTGCWRGSGGGSHVRGEAQLSANKLIGMQLVNKLTKLIHCGE